MQITAISGERELSMAGDVSRAARYLGPGGASRSCQVRTVSTRIDVQARRDAAAALRQNARSNEEKYTCVGLPDGRVGARLPGWTRPVRDDIKD